MPQIFFIFSLLFAQHSFAQEQPWAINFYLENDLFANTDLNYTNGIRASFTSPDISDFLENKQLKHPILDKLNTLLAPFYPEPQGASEIHRNIVISTGQLMFTPEDKLKQDLDKNDRPYAGWLYSGLGYQARTATKLHTLELNIGVVGPAALAKQSQNLIHDMRGIQRFHGWDNQLNNELGLQLIFERKRRFPAFKLMQDNQLSLDAISHWGASLGNVATYANVGGEVRLGRYLPQDFGTSALRPGADTVLPGRIKDQTRRWQAHGFIATDIRLVARNIFLDGNTFSNSHRVDKKSLVTDIAIGVSGRYKAWKLTYANVYRSREFYGQSKAQRYGALSISYSH